MNYAYCTTKLCCELIGAKHKFTTKLSNTYLTDTPTCGLKYMPYSF